MEFECPDCGAVTVLSHDDAQEKITEYVDENTCAVCFCCIPYKFLVCDDCLEKANKARCDNELYRNS